LSNRNSICHCAAAFCVTIADAGRRANNAPTDADSSTKDAQTARLATAHGNYAFVI